MKYICVPEKEEGITFCITDSTHTFYTTFLFGFVVSECYYRRVYL
jgi:hypothetical protein